MRRRNPTGALQMAEAAPIEDAVLITLGVVAVGTVAYLIYQQYQTATSAAAQAAATKEVMGYAPPPNAPTTIPNPSVFSGANPLAPWLPPGPTASNDQSYELGSGGSTTPLGPSAVG
jgi:hypothetical protein